MISLKQLFTVSYREKTYKLSVNPQKMKTSIAKKQLIFFERCIKNKILSKSFCLNPLIKFTEGYTILKDYNKKLITLGKTILRKECTPAQKREYQNYRTLDARLWTLDATLWTLGSGHWILTLFVSEQNQNSVSDSV